RAEAAAFAAWVAGEACQRTVYVLSGGQPGNRVAWEDDLANEVTHGFFRDLLPTLDRAYLRPNAPGFPAFQAEAGPAVVECLRGRATAKGTLAALEAVRARTLEA